MDAQLMKVLIVMNRLPRAKIKQKLYFLAFYFTAKKQT